MNKKQKSKNRPLTNTRPRVSTSIKQPDVVSPRPLAGQGPRTRGKRRPGRSGPPSWLWPLVVVLLVGAGLLVLLLFISNSNSNSGTPAGSGNIDGLVGFGPQSQGHVNGTVNYPQIPPVGGEHSSAWQNCGIYDQPVGKENAVHSLEHGAVWLTYRPDLPAEAVEQLRQQARGRSHVLLTPYAGLPAPVVASAWGLQLKVDQANDPRLAQFVSKYSQGPQSPEPGAPCFSGLGTPKER